MKSYYILIISLLTLACAQRKQKDYEPLDFDQSSSTSKQAKKQQSYLLQIDAVNLGLEDLKIKKTSADEFRLAKNTNKSLIMLKLEESQINKEIRPYLMENYLFLAIDSGSLSFEPKKSTYSFNMTATFQKLIAKHSPTNAYTMKVETFHVKNDGSTSLINDFTDSVEGPVIYDRGDFGLQVHNQVIRDFKREPSQFLIQKGQKPQLIRAANHETRHLAVIDELSEKFPNYEKLPSSTKGKIQQNIAQILHSRVQTADADVMEYIRGQKILVENGIVATSVLKKSHRYEMDGDNLTVKTDLLIVNKKFNEMGDSEPDSVMLVTREGTYKIKTEEAMPNRTGEETGNTTIYFSELEVPTANGPIRPIYSASDSSVSIRGEAQFTFRDSDNSIKVLRVRHDNDVQIVSEEPLVSSIFSGVYKKGRIRSPEGQNITPREHVEIQPNSQTRILDPQNLDETDLSLSLNGKSPALRAATGTFENITGLIKTLIP